MNADDLLKPKDEGALITEMDKVRPDWWVNFSDGSALLALVRSMRNSRWWAEDDLRGPPDSSKFLADYDRLVARAKHQALRSMQDAVWVIGHSMFQIAPKYVSMVAEFEDWLKTEAATMDLKDVGDAEEALREILANEALRRDRPVKHRSTVVWLKDFIERWGRASDTERFAVTEHAPVDPLLAAWRVIAKSQVDFNRRNMEKDCMDPNDDILKARCVRDFSNHLVDVYAQSVEAVLKEGA